MASSQENSDCQSSQPSQAKRIHFRSETYACSSDRTTIEEMADHVISRVIDTAAVCVHNSLGFTFLHPSRDEMEDPDNEKREEVDNDDSFTTTTEGMTFPVARRRQLEATKKISRSNTLTGAPIIMLEDEDYPQADGFNKTIGVEFIEKVISTWELSADGWSKRIEFLRIQSTANKSQYFYNTIFTPRESPIKTRKKIQLTAQVEFTLTANHLDPESRIIAEFRLEGQRFRHAPCQFRFRECWLQNIIDKKHKLIRQITL